MASTLRLLAAVDEMYERVATEPQQWHDQAFEDWAEDLAAEGMTRNEARAVRRCLVMGQKIRSFWADSKHAVSADDWRSRIDVAFGPRAWRPTLELAMDGLEAEPSPELFEAVKERFRVVNSEQWMEGVEYEEWVARRTDG